MFLVKGLGFLRFRIWGGLGLLGFEGCSGVAAWRCFRVYGLV